MSPYTRARAQIVVLLVFVLDCGCSEHVPPFLDEHITTAGGASSFGYGGDHSAGGATPAEGVAGGRTGRPTGGRPSTEGGSSMGGTAPADDGGSRGGVPPAGGAPSQGGSSAAGGASSTGDASDGDAGGAPPGRSTETPGIVVCGDGTCDVTASSGNACCVRNALFASKCEAQLTGCALNGGQTFNCDDTSDCPGGQLCCSFTLNTVTTTRCEASCEGFGSPTQLCRTDAQCGPKKCVVSEHIAEYSVCQ